MEPVSLVGTLVAIAGQIVQLAKTAKRNRRKCDQLKERVELIEHFLRQLSKLQWTPDPATTTMLQRLQDALRCGERLVQSCQRRKKGWNRLNVFSGHQKSGEFADLHKRISNIMQLFHISNRILSLSMNNERFFMNVLDKLLQNGACERLPHDQKEDLKASIRNLTNCEHYVTRSEKGSGIDKDGAASSTPLSPGGGGRGWHPGNDEITSIAQDIVAEAETVKHNKDEAQWLARLAQEVVYLMQDPQAPLILKHSYASRLKDDLKEALETIRSKDMHRTIPAMMHCGGGGYGGPAGGRYSKLHAIEICKVGYKIEYCLQVLPLVIINT
uniref:Mixed lineage kinase domain-containing protein n=1 Tax=Oryza punctata TaxID=4537 RepID=A0A0E0MI16_ORYPU